MQQDSEPATASLTPVSPPPYHPASLPSAADGEIPASEWYPSNPLVISPIARHRLARRLRKSDQSRPPIHSFASLDPESKALTYSLPPASSPARRYQLHIPALRTAFTFRLTHAAKEYIHQASVVFEEQANKLNLYLASIVPLPTTRQRWTVLRSPHVDKQAREQFEIRRHTRLVTIVLQEEDRDREEQQILKLRDRCAGMISERVTVTYRIPAGCPVSTLTFRGKEGRKAGEEADSMAGLPYDGTDEAGLAGIEPVHAYEAEDEDPELTPEEEAWGEDLLIKDRPSQKKPRQPADNNRGREGGRRDGGGRGGGGRDGGRREGGRYLARKQDQ